MMITMKGEDKTVCSIGSSFKDANTACRNVAQHTA